MRKTKETLHLSCVLTDEEKLSYSRDLAQHISDKKRKEDSLRSYQAQSKSEITSHDAQINLLSDKLNTGREFRDVECKVEYDWKKKEKRWIRQDTNEVARQTIISEAELQEHLELESEAAAEERDE